jgi:hypothetical protein
LDPLIKSLPQNADTAGKARTSERHHLLEFPYNLHICRAVSYTLNDTHRRTYFVTLQTLGVTEEPNWMPE